MGLKPHTPQKQLLLHACILRCENALIQQLQPTTPVLRGVTRNGSSVFRRGLSEYSGSPTPFREATC